jgi:hypothetical protein
MLKAISVLILAFWFCAPLFAQTSQAPEAATNSIQPSPPPGDALAPAPAQLREIKIPAGTPLEIEVAYNVSSIDTRVGDLISFRVVLPVKAENAILIDKNALVTGRLVKAKRAGHWGKAGKLAWTMQDAVAVDLTRVPLAAHPDFPAGQQGVTGQSHGAEVATKTAVMGALLAPTVVLAPLALMHGFKRGEQAVLPEGKRFIVYVQRDTIIRLPLAQPGPTSLKGQ